MGLNNQKQHCCECHMKYCRDYSHNVEARKVKTRPIDFLRDPRLFKGLAFTGREREILGLRGSLPAGMQDADTQVKVIMENLKMYPHQLGKYTYLREVQDANERLFYCALQKHTAELMPLVYTPTVGEACIQYSRLFLRPRGLYLSLYDSGHIESILKSWPDKGVKAIVVTDGERILGLGDLGANGMGIPIGKLILYTALAKIPPYFTLPVTIDVGTNNENLLKDPFYIGLKQARATGPAYDDLIDEFMEAVVKRYGRFCLIQFEDFANTNAFRLLEKYQKNYCTFNDDIQGTASVGVAGILASLRITGKKLTQNTFLFFGAGEAALGIAELLVMALEYEGCEKPEARKKIWMIDSNGLITQNRRGGSNTLIKAVYAKDFQEMTSLNDVINAIKPTVLIGASAQAGAFTEQVLNTMASISERPVIFALSNPTSKAECTAEQAYRYTDNRCVFASGSPFEPVTLNDGRTMYPGQGNNAYIFPGVALAIIGSAAHHIPMETFLIAAKALAGQVTKEDLERGSVYPPLSQIQSVSVAIAAKVSQYFYVESIATYRPEAEDKIKFLSTIQYDCSYGTSIRRHLHDLTYSVANNY